MFRYFIVNLLTLATGSSYSWSSPVLPKLLNPLGIEENPFARVITLGEKSWIAALVPLGAILGCPIGGILASKLGKKRALIVSGIPLWVSFMITAFAKDITSYYIARLLGGIGCGCCFTLVPLYVGEISEKINRGRYGCYFGVSINLGGALPYFVGPYCSVQVLSFLCSIPVGLFLIVFTIYFSETPYDLVSRGKIENAAAVLRKTRKCENPDEIDVELVEICDYMRNNANNRGKKGVAGPRSMILGAALMGFQQLCGAILMIAYLQTIFAELGNTVDPSVASIILASLKVVAGILGSFVVDKYGRRLLLITTACLISLSYLCLGTYFAMKGNEYNVRSYYWVPFLSISVFFSAYSLGMGPVVYTIMGELFDTNVKSMGSTMANCLGKTIAFVTTFVFPYITDIYGMHTAFYLLSSFAFATVIFVTLLVPETKTKSFAEIKVLLEERHLQIGSKPVVTEKQNC